MPTWSQGLQRLSWLQNLQKREKILQCLKSMKLVSHVSVTTSSLVFSSSPIFSAIKWIATVRFIRPTTWFWTLFEKFLLLLFCWTVIVRFSTSLQFQILFSILALIRKKVQQSLLTTILKVFSVQTVKVFWNMSSTLMPIWELIFVKTVDANVLTWTTVWQNWLS